MNRPQIVAQLRYLLSILSERNAHHEFEALCLEFSRARITPNIIPATGPVSAGGDQGADFESFSTFIGVRPGDGPSDRAVFLATLQKDDILKKIKSDLARVTQLSNPFTHAYYFLGHSLPVAKRHELQEWTQESYSISLEIFDAVALADQLASEDIFWIAVEFLNVPSEFRPFDQSLGDAYISLREKWSSANETPHGYADFLELRRGIRKSTFSKVARVDLDLWLQKMSELARSLHTKLARHASYELLVARLRGKGSWHGTEPDVDSYLTSVPLFNEPDEIDDAVSILTYAQGSISHQQSGLAQSDIDRWHVLLSKEIENKLEGGPPFHLRFMLLSAAARLAIFSDMTGPPTDEQWEKAIQCWSDALDIAEKSPLPPVDSISELIDVIADTSDTERLLPLQQRIDKLIADRHGAGAIAERARDRAVKLSEQGRIVDAIEQLHISKDRWFTGDTMRGSVLCLLILSEWYGELELHFASRLLAAAAEKIAFDHTDRRTSFERLKADTTAVVARTHYLAGEGLTFLYSLEHACMAHATINSDPWDLEKHAKLADLLVAASAVIGSTSRVAANLLPVYLSAVDKLTLPSELKDMIRESPHMEVWQKRSSEAAIAQCIEELGHTMFEDLGEQRVVRWSSIGLKWQASFPNAAKVAPLAEAAIGFLQMLQVEMSRTDLLLIPATVALRFEFASRGEPSFEEEGGNADSSWVVHLPTQQDGRDAIEQTLLVFALEALRVNSGLNDESVLEVLETRVKNGLFPRLFFMRPWPELLAFSRPQDLASTEVLRRATLPIEIAPHWPPEHEALAWCQDVGPGYDEAEALQLISNRYNRIFENLSVVLTQLKKKSAWATYVAKARSRGLLDWQILMAMANACISIVCTVSSPEEAQAHGKGGWEPLFARVRQHNFTDAEIDRLISDAETHEKMNVILGAKSWGIRNRRQAPNFDGLRHLLNVRYRYNSDDIPHPPIL